MTARKDFKRLVRERMARTGESYMTAARHMSADEEAIEPHEPVISVIEMVDLTAEGEELGFRCRVVMQPSLAERVDPATALARLRDTLLATTMDRAFETMRSVVLRGLRPRFKLTPGLFEDVRQFVDRAIAGVAGVSEGGHMLALTIDGKRGPVNVMFVLQLTPDFVATAREPCLVLTDPTSHTVDALRGLVHSLTENLTDG